MSIFKKFQEKAQEISDNLQKQKEKLESDWFLEEQKKKELEEQEKEKLSQLKNYECAEQNPYFAGGDLGAALINDGTKAVKSIVRKMR